MGCCDFTKTRGPNDDSDDDDDDDDFVVVVVVVVSTPVGSLPSKFSITGEGAIFVFNICICFVLSSELRDMRIQSIMNVKHYSNRSSQQ
mmetsp:Transcript_31202/g.44292  ORF Transcript_31202/g.44292 Transcript_31202/m.44292 type:complete len:89 (+) Transcript_31202:324-590(+)